MEYHRRALQIQKKSLAAENKYEMFETLVLIGNVYYSEQNNLSNIRTKGVDYKDFIESGFLGWIANAHDMRGEYGKAIQFYEESLQMAMSRSGKESKKETALTLNRLGSLTRELGRYDEVRTCIREKDCFIVSCVVPHGTLVPTISFRQWTIIKRR
jgi:tetratricopeptide (TPR) repeat protein